MPTPMIRFQQALLAALALDLVNNLAAWDVLARSLAARGIAPSPALIAGLCLASPVVGLLLWYFIARRRSVIAKWILAGLVALGVVGFILSLARAGMAAVTPMLIVAVVAEALKVFATTQLFLPAARIWLGETRDAA